MKTNNLNKDGISPQALEELEILIAHSLRATVRAKKAIIWFLRQSDYFKLNIAMSISSPSQNSDEYQWAFEMALSADYLNIPKTPMKLSDILILMGTSKHFSFHGGVAKKINEELIKLEIGWDSKNQKNIPVDLYGYTVWLADKRYQKEVRLIEFNPDEVQKVKLRKNLFRIASSLNLPEFYEDGEMPKDLLKIKCKSWGFTF